MIVKTTFLETCVFEKKVEKRVSHETVNICKIDSSTTSI